jgi:tRNA 2-thiouridine synthesizing protein A
MSARGDVNAMSRRLDLTGLKCPLPVLRTRKALRGLTSGSEIEVVCSDPMSAIDIPNMVREEAGALLEQRAEGGQLYFRIRKGEA